MNVGFSSCANAKFTCFNLALCLFLMYFFGFMYSWIVVCSSFFVYTLQPTAYLGRSSTTFSE